jgi:RNA 3'-terminal phosphate cyclase (ATP)
MGVEMELVVVRAGYVPRGAGVVELRVRPAAGALEALRLAEQGRASEVRGIAFSSHLAARRVSDRMAEACEARLRAAGLRARLDRADDTLAAHPGASLAVWTETSTGCVLGADRAGAPRRSSEAIGRFVAESLLADLATGATTDVHLGDQLVPFAAVAQGASGWTVPRATEHVASNLWLAERFGARARLKGMRVEIEGLGIRRSG